jgi:excisionase family DNA binding protein
LTAQLHSPEVPVDADIRLRAHPPADRCRVATAHRINYVHRPRRSRTTISFSDQVNARADPRLPPEQQSPTPIWGPCSCSDAAAAPRVVQLSGKPGTLLCRAPLRTGYVEFHITGFNGMPADSRDEFLTVAEVAELLRLNQQTVRNWIDRGSLPAIRVGARRVRIRRADLDAFLMQASGSDGTSETKPPAEADALSASDGRAELGQVLDHVRAVLDSGGDSELAEALRDLAETASRLARAVEQRPD